MSKVRHRVAALTLGGLLIGLPLLTNGTASAEQVEAKGRSVVFDGSGMLGLTCHSTPDVSSMTIPAESTVRVVNRTGHPARLKLGDAVQGTLPDDGSTAVVFRRGTTAVQLTPDCPLGTESTPLLVTATPEPSVLPPDPDLDPDPDPSETTDDDGEPSAEPSGSGSPSAPGPALPGTSATPGKPHHTTTATTRPGTTRTPAEHTKTPVRAVAVQTMPQGGAATTRVRTKVLRGTDVSTPTFAGMPPGEKKTIVSGVPTLDLPTISEAAALTPAAPPSDIAAAEPVAEMRPMPERGPVGLLAVVAGVLALGVAAAAIRSFVSQRASRAFVA